MGLDAYICYDFKGVDDEIESAELWYGRKKHEIHGWMQRVSGIAGWEFNCVPLPLTEHILSRLEADMESGNLMAREGFFFGSVKDPAEVKKEVQELLSVARDALADGLKPYYSSWW